ncbi:hypothetical protein ASPWEDRAFT_177569 [Aspergillus wentii DTO 134E9]|uniref:F-box domain-containing protein n=1 Tax=Aspergillus wentii DTO 134E9 TaxID=1073089 RepID=A0A1L9R4I3_ASPWE|nr:uncharacterized protein ASPWEDRAFT_177569 [Aspergillus wentii DTO 134E9]KAI9927109.1 hypothetical protein MW887_003492 [Aspergillus wentii]OJJ29831.1 hypothetical protein ASPWEDRAFT_177569 [Aspergillus wentii DTO 134E9]
MLLSLPPELIWHTLSLLIPADRPFALPPSHPATETLLNLTLVCKITHHIANRLLLEHCLHIKSGKSMDALLHGLLDKQSIYSKATKHTTNQPKSMIIQIKGEGLPRSSIQNWKFRSTMPMDELSRHAHVFDGFFTRVGHCLTRLVLDSQFHFNVSGEQPGTPISVLARLAFSRLTAIEEFVAVHMDIFSGSMDSDGLLPVWAHWPRLRRLALAHISVHSEKFLDGLRCCDALTHLVLVCPMWLNSAVTQTFSRQLPALQSVVVVRVGGAHFQDPIPGVEDAFLKGSFLGYLRESLRDVPVRISMLHVPVSPRRPWSPEVASSRVCDSWSCKKWLFHHAIHGSLWDLKSAPEIVTEYES